MKVQILIIFCFISCLISTIKGQVDCSGIRQTNCSICLNNSFGCGWCSSNKRCYPGNLQGPAVNETIPYCDIGWIYNSNYAASDCADECGILAQDCFDCASIQHLPCVWTRFNKCRLNSTVDPAYVITKCNCSMYKTCRECNAHVAGRCGYCPHLKQCMNVDDGKQFNCKFRLDGICPCNSTYSCLDCLENDGCGWCTKKGLCGDAGDMDFFHLCSNEPIRIDKCSAICSSQSTCKDCMSIEGVSCGWCKNNTGSYCMDLITTDICLIEACEPAIYPGGGFDGGSFVGGMFLALGLVGIAGAGYWYATRRQSYKPLN